MSCKDCIHYEICDIMADQYGIPKISPSQCGFYKNTADVVEVVRCRDCKYWGGVTYGYVCRNFSGIDAKSCTEADDYCSYGERREQNEG